MSVPQPEPAPCLHLPPHLGSPFLPPSLAAIWASGSSVGAGRKTLHSWPTGAWRESEAGDSGSSLTKTEIGEPLQLTSQLKVVRGSRAEKAERAPGGSLL
jgi:hypothetical protein